MRASICLPQWYREAEWEVTDTSREATASETCGHSLYCTYVRKYQVQTHSVQRGLGAGREGDTARIHSLLDNGRPKHDQGLGQKAMATKH